MANPVLPRGRNDWGYAIYRTVYTPESDAIWPSILAKLDAYVHRSIWQQVHKPQQNPSPSAGSDPRPFDYTTNTPQTTLFKNMIFSDKRKHNDESTEQIATHFDEFLEAVPPQDRIGISTQVCLIIDEDVFGWLHAAPAPAPAAKPLSGNLAEAEKSVCVKAVDADWDPDECDDERDASFEGWALVPVALLGRLYADLEGGEALGKVVRSVDVGVDIEEGVFIYEGS